jgi:NitT/TauT family transport system ATP-binding protein
MIELEDVGFSYRGGDGATAAVADVSLRVRRGATVAFVGPSGCGKSTLLRLVAGLLRATAGVVTVDGRRVEAPLKNVGMAFQNPVLLPWRTVLGNVLLPFEILDTHRRQPASERRACEERAQELLRTVGLRGLADKHPRELSGGMRQRVSLCRALVHEPELLLLDEPFAALDAFTREEMWELHQTLRQTRRFTGVLVTHDLREAVFLADTIYVMSTNPGRIAHVHHVALGFPRRLADCESEGATALIHAMREQIRRAH